jgi:large subunit ribosomal protein L21
MYAVLEDGSRQYKVSEGQVVRVDFRGGEDGEGVAPGTRVEFNRVLLYQNGDDTRIGQPLVEGARVVGEVVDHPSIKLYIQHFRRRKNYRRLRGHRQWYTAVRIHNILLPGQEVPAPAPAPATAPTPAPAPAGGPAAEAPAAPPAGTPPEPTGQPTPPPEPPPAPAGGPPAGTQPEPTGQPTPPPEPPPAPAGGPPAGTQPPAEPTGQTPPTPPAPPPGTAS